MRRKSRVRPRPSGRTNQESCLAVTRLRWRVSASQDLGRRPDPMARQGLHAQPVLRMNDNPPPTYRHKKAQTQDESGLLNKCLAVTRLRWRVSASQDLGRRPDPMARQGLHALPVRRMNHNPPPLLRQEKSPDASCIWAFE